MEETDAKKILKIVRRAEALCPELSTFIDLFLDLTICHIYACPLRLDDLYEADSFNFLHDVGGIARHLDRGKRILTDCFIPRFSATVNTLNS